MFDMTKTKVGDKLIDNQGRQWEVEEIDDCSIPYENGLPYQCQSCDLLGSWMWFHTDGTDADETGLEIVGFAVEQPTETVSENKGVKSDQREHNHYFKDVRHLEFIDVYRVIDLWELKDPALQHALKKLLVPGNRGHKDIQKDVQDVIDSCKRWQEMQQENEAKE